MVDAVIKSYRESTSKCWLSVYCTTSQQGSDMHLQQQTLAMDSNPVGIQQQDTNTLATITEMVEATLCNIIARDRDKGPSLVLAPLL
ncbi:uncharacterized protein TRIVIDRAFT_211879 [Trichoderma virens Gv29-8]|uniref:Uncharacterized protein n=1 Tax=Hypocrea virens (strain Gv29-8 / FGSC 10586) TaxID=413071 RepID=G9MIB9_HYPVG|nr:uncharacterized protein TRIVIDRAFT_211879 [Trichoderma virens Gv29-8]EHK25236.1 hypothetical protein TRIVIDRAFT_211879 [Trichoderma virens Gv29-8]